MEEREICVMISIYFCVLQRAKQSALTLPRAHCLGLRRQGQGKAHHRGISWFTFVDEEHLEGMFKVLSAFGGK